MSSKAKRILALLLSVVLAVSVLAGCAAQTASSSSSAASSSQAQASSAESKAEEPAAPMDIKWLSFYGPEAEGSYPQKFLEEKFNVKITNMLIDRNSWDEQLNVKLAGGDIPDVFFTWGGAFLANYVSQGVVCEIPREKIEEKMPIYYRTVMDLDPNLFLNGMVDGKNYAVSLYWDSGKTPQLPVYNKKWLENVGAEVPKTIDEFVDVMTKFTKNDPDKNGKDDTYGVSFRGKDSPVQTMIAIYGAYGVPVLNYTVADDKDEMVMSFFTQAWKDATALIQKMYKDGVIDPESITDDNAQLTQKFANGRVGVQLHGLWYHWLPNIGGYRIAADNAGVEIAIGPLPTTTNTTRQSGVNFGNIVNSPIGMGIQVEKDTAKMDRILEIFEALHSDDETYIATNFGEEGVTYDMVDGVPVRNPIVGDAIQMGTKYGIGVFYSMFSGGKSLPMFKYDYTADQLKVREEFIKGSKTIFPYFIGNPASSSKYPDLQAFMNQNLIKFVIGELNLEGDLENFQKQYLEMGGEVLQKETNDLYQSQKK